MKPEEETNLSWLSLPGNNEAKQSKIWNPDYHSDKTQKYTVSVFHSLSQGHQALKKQKQKQKQKNHTPTPLFLGEIVPV